MYQPAIDLFASISFMLIGILVRIEASKVRILSFGSLAGDFFPKVMSSLLIILSCVWFFISLAQFLRIRSTSIPGPKLNTKKVIIISSYLIMVCILIHLLKIIGFVLFSIFLSLITYLYLKTDIAKKDIMKGTIYSIIVAIATWFIFVQTLGLILPKGTLFY